MNENDSKPEFHQAPAVKGDFLRRLRRLLDARRLEGRPGFLREWKRQNPSSSAAPPPGSKT